jgi:hypothetical protein
MRSTCMHIANSAQNPDKLRYTLHSMAVVASRRTSSPLSVEACVAGLKLIPQGQHLVKYSKWKNFKLIPGWDEIAKYALCLSSIIGATGGFVCHQSALIKGVASFSADNGLGLSPNDIEECAYALRSMISQIANHKMHQKLVPRAHQAKFQHIYDKIIIPDVHTCDQEDNDDAAQDDAAQDDAAEDSDHAIASSIEAVESSTDMESAELFHSNDPELNNLLQGTGTGTGAPQVNGSPEGTVALQGTGAPQGKSANNIGGIAINTLVELSADASTQPVSPAAWAALQAAKKKEAADTKAPAKEGKGKKQKKPTTKKRPAAAITADIKAAPEKVSWNTYSKREHSRIWHGERAFQLSIGLTKSDAAMKAADAAADHMKMVRAKRLQGELNDILIIP